MAEQRKITVNNFHINTRANFKPFSPAKAEALLDAMFSLRRKRKPELRNATTIEVDGETWEILHTSGGRNSYFHSRAFSYYFRKKGGRSVVRISDHWSESGSAYSRSRKLNCGSLRSCFWSNLRGESFDYRVPGETYDSRFLSGICSFASFEV